MRIEGSIQGQGINLSELKGILEKLNVGDVVKAKILEITSSDVLLKLFDGSTVKASTASNIEGKQGDVIDLVVKNKTTDNQLILETVKNEVKKPSIGENEIKNQLSSMGLKDDTNNLEIVKQLKTNNLPVNKEVLNKIVDLVTKFKDLTPSKAAFLISGNMELEEKNISALNQIVEGKTKLAVKLNDILKMVDDIEDTDVLKVIDNQLKNLKSAASTSTTTSVGTVVNKAAIEKQPTNNIKNSFPVKYKASSEIVENFLKETLKNLENQGIKSNIASNIPDKLSEFLKVNDITTNSSEKFIANLNKETGFLNKLPLDDQNIIKNVFNNLFLKIKNNLLLNNDDLVIQKTTEDVTDIEKIKASISKAFESFRVDIKSETLKEDINVKNIYKDIYGKLEAVKDSITNSSLPTKHEITNNIDNLQNNMRFMNDLSNHNTYIQIPLQIWNKNTTGELYILKKDSKKKKIDPENVSIFISLETQNLGQVDSLISVNKKNISVNLRLEDQEIIDYIKENYKELYNKLQEKGYKLVDVKYRLIEEEANLLNIKDIVNKGFSVGQGTIDFRL